MISLICEQYNITNYTINDDGSIDVDGDVDLWGLDLTELPLSFNKVSGYFWIGNNRLTSLKGCPRWVGSWFSCNLNLLISLEFSPDYVGGYLDFRYNPLTDNYCDTEIGGCFYTTSTQDGLVFIGNNIATNYKEWRKLYKRKKILDDIFNM